MIDVLEKQLREVKMQWQKYRSEKRVQSQTMQDEFNDQIAQLRESSKQVNEKLQAANSALLASEKEKSMLEDSLQEVKGYVQRLKEGLHDLQSSLQSTKEELQSRNAMKRELEEELQRTKETLKQKEQLMNAARFVFDRIQSSGRE